ncbi:MAG: hypothetical protein ACM3XS_03895, partial [Bacteroidota bacterium]
IENELDFFPCRDVPGYLEKLYRMARERGITVPITACVGQGDVEAATGSLAGLWPTMNLYPRDDAPGIEDEVAEAAVRLYRLDLPPIITETGRNHLLLRRLLAGGAKGICAFLQVGGNNLGLYEAVNNWRVPGAFLATASDFGGMIDGGGRIRSEYYQGRLFSLALAAVKDLLAGSRPEPSGSIVSWNDQVGSPSRDGSRAVRSLRAPGGAIFAMPANLSETEQPARLTLAELTVPRRARLILPPRSMPIFPFHLDLRSRGAALELVYALSELAYADRLGDTLVVAAHGPEGTEGELLLRGRAELLHVDEGISICRDGGEISLRYPHDRERLCHLGTDSGRVLFILTSSSRAQRLWPLQDGDGRTWLLFGADYAGGEVGRYEITPGCGPLFLLGQGSPGKAESRQWMGDLGWARLAVGPGEAPCGTELTPRSLAIGLSPGYSPPVHAKSLHLGTPPLAGLESVGLGKGLAWYRTRLEAAPGEALFYADAASDVVSLYAGGEYAGTYVPWGGELFCPLRLPTGADELTLRVEIWGHSNFHEPRRPALALGSPRGLLGRTGLLRLWRKLSASALGGEAVFTLKLPREEAEAIWVLKLPQGSRQVAIDGVSTEVRDKDGYMVLPRDPGGEGRRIVALRTEERAAELSVYRGFPGGDWEVRMVPGRELPRWEAEAPAQAGLPLHLAPGFVAVVRLRWPDFPWSAVEAVHLVVDGRDCKLTACVGGEVAGRLWLPSAGRPPFAGGPQDGWIFVPRAWLEADPEMRLIVEAVGERPGLVNGLHLDIAPPRAAVELVLDSLRQGATRT